MISKCKRSKIFILALFTMGIMLLSDYSTLTVKAWKDTDHAVMMNQVVSDYSINNFSSKELNLLYTCSELPDQSYYRSLDASNPSDTVSALHGRKNYISALRYMYEISFRYLANPSKETYTGSLIDEYFASCNYINPYRKDIAKINDSLKRLLNFDVLNNSASFKDDYEKSNRKKAVKVMGFACHLIGDTFAHVSTVPNMDNFKLSMFKDTAKYSAQEKYDTFARIVAKYQIPFADLAKLTEYEEYYRSDPANCNYLENEYDEALLNSISEDFKSTSKYEDNTTFYKSRVNGTKIITGAVLQKFNAALLAKDQGTYIDGTFDTNLYDGYRAKLRRYEEYKAEARVS